MQSLNRSVWLAAAIGGAIGLAACGAIPTSGPSRSEINASGSGTNQVSSQGIQVVNVTDQIARQLYAGRKNTDFAATLGDNSAFQQQLGVGDVVEVSIWEAPPATLFGGGTSDAPTSSSLPTGARLTKLPTQVIDGSGNIHVPFVGAVKASGRTPSQLQALVAARLKNIAHDPQVLVQLARNETSYVTVVGDVSSSTRMQLSARGERVLDAVAAAGGVKQPINKIMIQVTRGETVALEPLETVIRDPRQNVPLRAGDVVTALFQPYSFTAFGATGKNEEINFEAQGITLAQALARAGGLQDSRSDAQGVFIFRLEDQQALNWPNQPVRTTANGKVPVIYHINLKDPDSFFVAQSFMMDNRDVLYVSNAPVAELQKVLNLVFSVAYPIVSGVQTFK
ncbi:MULTISPECIES: polysaccharide biosynthesis/export family protein [Burkholderia]|uniref:Capsular biosynthesis protein n=1 Tax=Burkholderia cenocepacia TaxID=95486 RepID=A0A071MTB7_9BURK|nr:MULTISPECIES: polysaccharide biosynthesis/export family protein [Burkholderia]AOJ23956.1 capsular biosynthesis protein [Burkholderia seminalis]KVF50297.1 capsular biosynthesis protein [Burkholderia seminalis]MBN3741356.1 polysaccharide export protein [Burkholderia sp. Tr-20355]MCA8041743.1 polysaccharide export protein [Burkholderia seminalis]MCA8301557.1 polysaccharide export protein [Burkholderia seminalis]